MPARVVPGLFPPEVVVAVKALACELPRDVTIATDLGVPRSTVRGWLSHAPKVVVSLDVTDLRTSELQQEVLELRRRVKKLAALLRLALS